MLKTHYRSPLNFNQDNLNEAKHGLSRLYTALKPYKLNLDTLSIDWDSDYAKRFKIAMNDDFNTSLAISILFEICSSINRQNDVNLAYLLIALAHSLGLLMRTANEYLQIGATLSAETIEQLIIERKMARLKRDFALADKIRDDLLASGIILEDNQDGTSWRKE